MELICNGSGSSGNSYLLTNGNETLVIEVGLPLREVKKALDFNIASIVGAVVTHEHGDHFKYHKEYENAGIPIYAPFTMENDQTKVAKFGGFSIQGFPVPHSVPCYGFYIKHVEIGKLVFMTDMEYCPVNFSKLRINHLLVEANYSPDLVDEYEPQFAHRILGHCSIDTAIGIIEANKSDELKTVTLIHLSDSAGDADHFADLAKKVVDCLVYVAHKGLEIEI